VTANADGPPVARPAAEGAPLATIKVPRFGADWEWVTLEGTDPEVLAHGPGHYPATALPGGIGNTAFAAPRAGHGDPFLGFDELRPRDAIVIQQGAVTWTYRLTGPPQGVVYVFERSTCPRLGV